MIRDAWRVPEIELHRRALAGRADPLAALTEWEAFDNAEMERIAAERGRLMAEVKATAEVVGEHRQTILLFPGQAKALNKEIAAIYERHDEALRQIVNLNSTEEAVQGRLAIWVALRAEIEAEPV